jgi:hypothetical protein
MANDWTRLLQETAKHGGPAALKAFYANKGRWEGAGGMLLIGAGVALLVKARQTLAKVKTVHSPVPGAAVDPIEDEPLPPLDETTETEGGSQPARER